MKSSEEFDYHLKQHDSQTALVIMVRALVV